MRLEHANLTVTDVDRSAAFYCDLFDASIRWRGPDAAGREAAHVGDDDHYLALFTAGDPGGRALVDYDRPGLNHIGFVVDDLDAMRARVEALGASVHLEADYEPGRRLYFMDPDGNEIELVEYA